MFMVMPLFLEGRVSKPCRF